MRGSQLRDQNRSSLQPATDSQRSKRMYEERLRAWGVGKNMKAAEKDRLFRNGEWLNADKETKKKVKRHLKSTKRPQATDATQHLVEFTDAIYLHPGAPEMEIWHMFDRSDISSVTVPTTQASSVVDNLVRCVGRLDKHIDSCILSETSVAGACDATHSLVDTLSAASSTDLAVFTPVKQIECLQLWRPLCTPPDTFRFDVVSKSIEQVCQLASLPLSHASRTSWLSTKDYLRVPWSHLRQGIYQFKLNDMERANCAFQAFVKASAGIFNDVPTTLAHELLATASSINLCQRPQFRSHLLRYLHQMAIEQLGESHPISTICKQLQHADFSEPACARLLMILGENLDTSEHLSFMVKISVTKSLRRCREYGDAEQMVTELLASQSHTTNNSLEFRIAARALAHIYVDRQGQGDLQAAKGLCLAAAGCTQTWRQGYIDNHAIAAMEDLAKICAELGDKIGAITWLKDAADLAIQLSSPESSLAAIHIVDKLLDLLEREDLQCESVKSRMEYASWWSPKLTQRADQTLNATELLQGIW